MVVPSNAWPQSVATGPLRVPLFGTDGIRGNAGQQLTPSLALQVGFWAGQVLHQHQADTDPFILGQDSRNSSDMLAMALSAGLTAAGLDVWHLGLCPTPTVAYLTHITAAVGGVMVSASHNPPADNGIKFFGADGAKLALEVQRQIEHHLHESVLQLPAGNQWGRHYYRPELTQDYLNALQHPLQQGSDFKGLRIVLDLAWGAAVHLAPALFEAMGAEVICLHAQPNGDCINVNCGSTHLGPLQAAIKTHQANLGFAFDGDADRVLAMDAWGRTVDGDYILYFWGQTLKQRQQLPHNLIVSTVMSNLGFERAWQQQEGQLIRAAVGDQYVHAAMMEHGAMLGGEQSGHILCRHYGIGGDGLLTAFHLTAIIQQAGVTLAELIDASFQTYPQRLSNVHVEDSERRCGWKDCQPLQAAIAKATDDMGNQGRILVRASGTEPLLRIMVEASQMELVNHWTDYLVDTAAQYLVT